MEGRKESWGIKTEERRYVLSIRSFISLSIHLLHYLSQQLSLWQHDTPNSRQIDEESAGDQQHHVEGNEEGHDVRNTLKHSGEHCPWGRKNWCMIRGQGKSVSQWVASLRIYSLVLYLFRIYIYALSFMLCTVYIPNTHPDTLSQYLPQAEAVLAVKIMTRTVMKKW